MPPKGWRKNAEGNYPHQKNSDVTSIDEILFPRATVQKLAKGILNSTDETEANVIMARDSVLALQRSATVFVSHLLFHARQISKTDDRKTINVQDILYGIERADFPGFLPEVKQKLGTFEQQRQNKKTRKIVTQEANGDEQEPSVKRAKDNDSNALERGDEDEEEDEEVEEVEEIEVEEPEKNGDDDLPVVDEDEVEEEEDEAIRTQNPISLLEREEKELQGDNESETNEVENEDDEEEEEE
ncbi:DNA polymerase epsilon subunit D [[Candida] anglica]|uniref:DNA polymerase epsilon subunit D n=1 Tax=[Candida] anglica TaxID=148631 RepID=A0ABP0EB83_9ASCO